MISIHDIPLAVERAGRYLAAVASILLLCQESSADQASGTLLLRFPDIHGGRVVFTHAGDLWDVAASGGAARRLTAGEGVEQFAKFSPDGRWIAFTAELDGDQQVYVIPAEGGEPRRLTFYPARGPLLPRQGHDNQVHGWSPDGRFVLAHSMRDSAFITEPRLYAVPFEGGAARALPMPVAGAGTYSPDGRSVLYSPHYNEFRPWKGYQGGWARDLWIYDLATGATRNVTSHPRSDGDPMWTRHGIRFVSDRDGRANLYALEEVTGEVRRLTAHTSGDVRWASADPVTGSIVYELDGSLRILDPSNREDRSLEIRVAADYPAARPASVGVDSHVEHAELSPDGRRLLVVARGDVFTLPVGEGARRNLTHSPGAHDREAVWSPDGTQVAFISDASGEEEIWIATDDTPSAARAITRGHTTRFYRPRWSPDGARIAVADRDGAIHVVTIATGAMVLVARTGAWFSLDYEWSPDGLYLAYTQLEETFFSTVHVWDRRTNAHHRLTDPVFNSFSPVWDPSGDFLFVLSDREPSPVVDGVEWNYAADGATVICAIRLRADAHNPFLEFGERPNESEGDATTRRQNSSGLDIDLQRAPAILRVPLPAANYTSLAVTKTGLLYGKRAMTRFESLSSTVQSLTAYTRESGEQKVLSEDVGHWSSSAEGAVLIAKRQSGTLRSLRVLSDGRSVDVDLTRLRVRREPRQEWAAIFHEVWRRYRDYFYAENMHERDWEALRQRYAARLAHVHHSSDLIDVISEMIGELDVSHAYFSLGDQGKPRPRTGLLGARLELDSVTRRYRFASILPGDEADAKYRSPLAEPGVEVRVGEFLLAIDGEPLDADVDPYSLLVGKAGEPVELLVAPSVDGKRGRRVVVRALESEAPLLYWNWVARNRQRVDELSGGRIGYLHIPDMSSAGLREFVKWYYGQIRKDGLIVDVRYNDGGNTSRMILERLTRRHYGLGYIRGVHHPTTYPWGRYTHVFTGEMALLVNEQTKSDGEALAWAFREAQRGPVIGARTWGGTVGTGNSGPLLDGGSTGVPQYMLADRTGARIVEGVGVVPDLEVVNDVASRSADRDLQIEAAVSSLLDSLRGSPGTLRDRTRQTRPEGQE